MSLPPLSAIQVYGNVTRFGFVPEADFLIVDGWNESGERERRSRRGRSGGTFYVAYIDPAMALQLSVRVKERRGLANAHIGSSLTMGAIKQYLNPVDGSAEDRGGFPAGSTSSAPAFAHGVLVVSGYTYAAEEAGGLQSAQLTVRHELASWSSHTPTDADAPGTDPIGGGAGPIEVPGTTPATPTGPGAAVGTKQVYRFFYDFTPAKGSGGEARSGFVTRILTADAALSLSALYGYKNPPSAGWSNATSATGPDWSYGDGTGEDDIWADVAAAADRQPGFYELTGVYQLNTNDFLLGTAAADKFDSVAHGTACLIVKYDPDEIPGGAPAGKDTRILLGNFANLAAVEAFLSVVAATDLISVYDVRTNTYWHGTGSGDPAAPWRLNVAKVYAGEWLVWHAVAGTQTNGRASAQVRVSRDDFNPARVTPSSPQLVSMGYNYLYPAGLYFGNLIASAVKDQEGNYVLGNSGTSHGFAGSVSAFNGGDELWVFQRNVAGNPWDFRVGNYANYAGFLAANGGSESAFLNVYEAGYDNGDGTVGKFWKGTFGGDPLQVTSGLNLY